MTPKRVAIISGVLWLLAVAVGSSIEVRWDAWWTHFAVGIMRGAPLAVFVLAYWRTYGEQRKPTRPQPEER